MGVSASDSSIKKCYDCGNWLASVYRDPINNAHFCERCHKLRLQEQGEFADEQYTQHR